MKKYFILFLIISFLFPVLAHGAEPVFVSAVINSTTEPITSFVNQKGRTYTTLGGSVRFGIQPGALPADSSITFNEVDASILDHVLLPAEYKQISKIFQYTASTKPLKPLWLQFDYTSDLRFQKYLFRYNEVKQNWETITSTTDLDKHMVKASLTKQSGILMIVDTDVMKYGKASWYKFKGCMCAASPDYPKGTMLTVVNKNKNQAIQVRVNDWGPERDIFPERVIDLDVVAFTKFATKGAGVLQNIYVIPYHASDFSATDAAAMEAGKTISLTVEQIAKLEGMSQKTEVGSQKSVSVISSPSSPLKANSYNLTPAAPLKSTATTQPPTYLWLK